MERGMTERCSVILHPIHYSCRLKCNFFFMICSLLFLFSVFVGWYSECKNMLGMSNITNLTFTLKHPRWCNTQTHNNVFSHTPLTLLRMFIIWQIVSTSGTGHHGASVQEHECIQKLSTTW
jgi:hypothetical protein